MPPPAFKELRGHFLHIQHSGSQEELVDAAKRVNVEHSPPIRTHVCPLVGNVA